jgi:hypothetical protein
MKFCSVCGQAPALQMEDPNYLLCRECIVERISENTEAQLKLTHAEALAEAAEQYKKAEICYRTQYQDMNEIDRDKAWSDVMRTRKEFWDALAAYRDGG